MKKTLDVNAFMDQLDHPLKPEVEVLREIIKNVSPEIIEELKWKAPSYSYRGEYLVTFNLWEKGKINLVFHNHQVAMIKNKLLEGEYKDRRMAYFTDLNDITAKKNLLEKALKDLIRLQKKVVNELADDQQPTS